MQIPKKIRIGGIDYKILMKEEPISGETLCYGVFDAEKCVIELMSSRELAHDRRCVTFLHEIIHAIILTAAIELDDEELTARTLARGLYQVMQDNPAVFERPKTKQPEKKV